MSSGDSDVEYVEDNLPSAKECEERCSRFAEVTGTDSAMAMFFLQDRDWNIDQALNAFFEQNGGTESNMAAVADAHPSTNVASSSAPTAQPSGSERTGTRVSDPEPSRFRVLSWNIDGLQQAHIKQRTRAVVDTIKKEKVEVVLLQEVVGASEAILRENLSDYRIICAGTTDKQGYYTAVLLHKLRVMLDDFSIEPFHSSVMARNLLTVDCCVKGVPMRVITSHLESTKSHAGERKKQLQTAFKHVTESPRQRTVVFGGDLNLRDKELDQIGGLPQGISDMWEATGRRKEAQYTWDTTHNDNLGTDFKWASKLRFDRLFLRQRGSTGAVKPVYFELVGLERLEGVRCFPSDHWGILTHFDILPSFDESV